MDPLDPDSDAAVTAANESANGVVDGREDFDGDSLPLAREFEFGTDPRVSDTDGDGLSDRYELEKSLTDPGDTATRGAPDGTTDADGDGLTTAEEARLGSYAWLADSDADGLDDRRERRLGADPLSNDTDDDGLSDRSEIRIGTTLTTPDTDGDGTPDGAETYTTRATNASLGVSVAVTGTGDVAAGVEVERDARQTFDTPTLRNATATPVVQLTSDRSFRSADVSLSYDDDDVGNESRLSVYRYNESRQTFQRLPSTVDPGNDTVRATVSGFSTFTVMNRTTWSRGVSADPPRPVADEWRIPTYLDTFADGRAENWTQDTENKDPTRDGGGGFPGFGGGGGFPDPVNDRGGVGASSRQLEVLAYGCFVTRAERDIGAYNGTVRVRFNWSEVGINEANLHEANVSILADGTPVSYALEPGASKPSTALGTQGTFNATAEVDGNVSIRLTVRADPPAGSGGFSDRTCSLTYQAGKRLVVDDIETSITVEDPVDSDGDQLPDSLERQGIPLGTGETLTTDPTDPDTDGDGLEDGAEIRVNRFIARGSGGYFLSQSDPTDPDSDGDGLPDYDERQIETNPLDGDSDGDDLTDGSDYQPTIARDVDRTPPVERAKSFVEGAVLGAAGAPSGAFSSPRYNRVAYVLGEIAIIYVPVVGKLAEIRDIAANIRQGKELSVAISVIGLVPGPGDVAKSTKTIVRHGRASAPIARKTVRVLAKTDFVEVTPGLKRQILAAGQLERPAKRLFDAAGTAGGWGLRGIRLAGALPDDVPMRRVKYARVVDDTMFYVTEPRWDQILERHVTGTQRPDDVTRFFPAGERVPAGRFRPARRLPGRMSRNDIRDVLFQAAADSTGGDLGDVAVGRFGIQDLRIVSSARYDAVVGAYPETGPAVYEWNGTAWVNDPPSTL
ncbi:MAG: hypothetical protein V5A31_11080 [Haloferacaceae archaeon]